MKFNDVYFNRHERFALGVEEGTGKFYVSIPVSNRAVDYEEYYEVSKNDFDIYLKNPSLALPFVERCRSRKEDSLLLIKPGLDRGVAS